MSSPRLYFPDENTITQNFLNDPFFKVAFFQEKGISKAIAELAAKRFSNGNIGTSQDDLNWAANKIVDDLLSSNKNGYRAPSLPSLSELRLDDQILWSIIPKAIKDVLLGCANKV